MTEIKLSRGDNVRLIIEGIVDSNDDDSGSVFIRNPNPVKNKKGITTAAYGISKEIISEYKILPPPPKKGEVWKVKNDSMGTFTGWVFSPGGLLQIHNGERSFMLDHFELIERIHPPMPVKEDKKLCFHAWDGNRGNEQCVNCGKARTGC